MPVFYIDTSALPKRYRSELRSETLQELFVKKQFTDIFITSHFTTLEIQAIASRALRGRRFDQEAYQALLGQFAEDVSTLVSLQSVSSLLIANASEIIRRHSLRAPDALHLATALGVQDMTKTSVVFLCSDRALLSAALAESLDTLDPTESEAIGNLRELRGAV